MMDRLLAWDTDLLMWINSHNSPTLDWIMWIASQSWSWAVVMLTATALVTLRYEPRRWWVVLLALGFCILLGDRISVMAFKDVFHRLRPCHVIENLNMFRTGCGGQYGFVSSHATNIFSLVTFFVARYAFRKSTVAVRHKWLLAIVLTLWALLVCYSRPYLGKHYPGDVACGALLGIAVGLAVHFLTRWAESRLEGTSLTTSEKQ